MAISECFETFLFSFNSRMLSSAQVLLALTVAASALIIIAEDVTTLASIETTLLTSTSSLKKDLDELSTELSILSTAKAQTQPEKIVEPPWECPNITKDAVECSCDFPHTLRCTGDRTALQVILVSHNKTPEKYKNIRIKFFIYIGNQSAFKKQSWHNFTARCHGHRHFHASCSFFTRCSPSWISRINWRAS